MTYIRRANDDDVIKICNNCRASECRKEECVLRGGVPMPDRPQPYKKEWEWHKHDYPVGVGGEKHTLKEWAKITGLDYMTIYMRIHRGWTPEKAITTPRKVIRKKRRNEPDEHPEQHRPADP